MNGRETVVAALKSSLGVVQMFLADLSDADLLVRPTEGANHIAWQLGHLIWSESQLAAAQLPGVVYPTLPAGFREQHDKAGAARNDGFASKQFYLELLAATRAATCAGVEKLTDADLARKTEGPMAPFAPRWGDLFLLVANHTLMHGGQFSVVRRKLGKPVLF